MKKNDFSIEKEDVALVITKDMKFQLILPEMEPDESVSMSEHENIFVGMALVSILGKPEFKTLLGTELNKMFEEASVIPKCPSDGCGGGCSC